MKNVFLTLCALCFLYVNAQENPKIDTLQIRSLEGIKSMGITRTGNDTLCQIDGKAVSYAEYISFLKSTLVPKTCKPCYVQLIDLKNRLTEEGLYYVGEREGFEKEIYLPFSNSKYKKLYIKDDSYYDGPVKYYKKNGKLKRVVYYDKGIKIRKKK